MNYRAEIDGLRAIAVVSVILYHAQIVIFGRDWFEGGFIGVDIFFVISGYLITRIILTELEQTNTFSFIKFYERRARRILPMLLVVITVCIPFAWQKLLPLDLVEFAKSSLSAIGFGSNFFFYFSTTEYGATSALLKPLLHTWSLGVEEQFYIIVPIIILAIWKFARASLLTLLIGMLIVSIQFADVMEVRNSELNFFLPFSHFWELLVGSALAFIELKYGRSKNPILTQTLPITGLFLIAHSIIFFDASTPHPSFQTLIPILGVALVLAFCSTEDFVGKILSLKPIVGIGLISYSLYLWHFPIFAFGRISSSNPSTYDKVEWTILAFVLSIVSYFFIEKTFRNPKVINRKLFCGSVVVSVVVLSYVNYDFISKDGYEKRLPPILFSQNVYSPGLKKDGLSCYSRRSEFCQFVTDEKHTKVFVFGDSHLQPLSYYLEKSLRGRFSYVEGSDGGCPFILNTDQYHSVENISKNCPNTFQQTRMEEIGTAPSIVVIGGRFPLYLTRQHFDNQEEGVERQGILFEIIKSNRGKSTEEEIRLTIESLIQNGHEVVLIYPVPEVGVNVPKYLYKQMITKYGSLKTEFEIAPLTTSTDVYFKRSQSTFDLFDSIESPHIHRVYPHKIFCDEIQSHRCFTQNKTEVFYYDDDHLSKTGAKLIVDLIIEKIENAEANIRGN